MTRSFDERYHTYLGYNLRIEGVLQSLAGEYIVAIGKAAQAKNAFRVGDTVTGQSVPVPNRRLEDASFYKTIRLSLLSRMQLPHNKPPPWLGPPPALEVYRDRGHRRLATVTYRTKCWSCIWGSNMPVEMIIDPWNPSFQYRFETFCFGPKSCPSYHPGPTRKVPGRKGMVYEEEDWVDEDATAHRSADE
jgi:hypothetical protein